jgi:hypothetical protein
MANRIFYDSVTATDIPVSVGGKPIDGVLGYVDGRYAWSEAAWNRFSSATTKVRIAVLPTTVADVLDVESGNPSTPEDCVSWYRKCIAAGVPRPTIYCSYSAAPAIEAAFQRAGYKGAVDFDIAHWTGRPHTLTLSGVFRVPCVQYSSPETGAGGHFDLNLVTDDNWPRPATPSTWSPIDGATSVPTVAPTTAPIPTPTINFPVLEAGAGMGAQAQLAGPVAIAQGIVNAYGYGIAQDGAYGVKTEGAVMSLQKRLGVTVDGKFGPETLAAALHV